MTKSWKIESHPLKELATGSQFELKTYTIEGAPGPHLHIQASVHGAELQGNAVILELMEKLNTIELKGSITFIPLANPYATNNKHGTYTYGRYNPITGHNWNRNYVDIILDSDFDIDKFAKENKDKKWSEIKPLFKIALQTAIEKYRDDHIKNKSLSENNKLNILLQRLAAPADGILDLHTGPVSTRYLYAARYEEAAARALKFKHILFMPEEFAGAMDEASFMPWIHLRDALKKLGREIKLDIEALTLEFGSEETFSMENASKDVESILNYMRFKGMIEGEVTHITTFESHLADYTTIYSPRGGLVDYHKKPGDSYKKGDVLASFYTFSDLDPKKPIASSKSEVCADTDGIIINRCPSSSVHQGMELFQVMSNITTNEAR